MKLCFIFNIFNVFLLNILIIGLGLYWYRMAVSRRKAIEKRSEWYWDMMKLVAGVSAVFLRLWYVRYTERTALKRQMMDRPFYVGYRLSTYFVLSILAMAAAKYTNHYFLCWNVGDTEKRKVKKKANLQLYDPHQSKR